MNRWDAGTLLSMAESPFKYLTVIGTGLLGGSFAMACRQMYPDLHIQAVDSSEKTLQYALRAQVVDKVSLKLPVDFEEDHLIVLATHLTASIDLLKELTPKVKGRNITVTDIGSCKRAICKLGEAVLPSQFIGGHPLAGKEFSGIEHATGLLFAQKPYAFCPPVYLEQDAELQDRFDKLKAFITVGLRAKIGELDTEEHDRYMAFVSHFPQLYAIMLTNLLHRNQPGKLLAFHGAGIDDQLRLAASPYEMWRDIFELNQDNILSVIQQFSSMATEAEDVLTKPPMAMWFNRANELHQEFHEFRLN